MKKNFVISALVLSLFGFFACSNNKVLQNTPIVDKILNDENSFFYIDVKNYPQKDKSLPIGIFDSGTGGLTVLDAMINSDNFNNESHKPEILGDKKIDFLNESFIYLGDKANMPYGDYSGKNKTDLLKEHIIKDAQFLLGNKYYKSQNAKNFSSDKSPIKALVIACNTATAYGKTDVEQFIEKAGLDIKVIGVIDAGVRGALEKISKTDNAVIGIMATAGTVASNGYPNTVIEQKQKLNYLGEIITFQQPGIGLAGAIDGEKDYLDASLTAVRKDYHGPSFTNIDAIIDKSILKRYNFDFSNNKMLFVGSKENPTEIQINSVDNYIKYNVISLLETIKSSKTSIKLNSVILGCTHYPFFMENFKNEFNFAYNYKENGEYIYRNFMVENISLVDPAINTAKELYVYLDENNLFNNGNIENSEFFISVPNLENKNNKMKDAYNFTYDYKYGRNTGEIHEYIKNVPFSDSTISNDLMERLKEQIPFTYKLINNNLKK